MGGGGSKASPPQNCPSGGLKQYCYTDLQGKKNEINVICNCYGEECENWFPPRDSGYDSLGLTYDGLSGCVIMNTQYADYLGVLTNMCITGEPTFTYNTYSLIPYQKKPTIIDGTYIPLKITTNYGYYDYGFFSNPLIDLPLSLNPGPSSLIITDKSNATCTQQFNYDLKNISSAFAVYSITYTIKEEDFSNSNFPNELLDLFYFYENLSNTFTFDFKNSCYYNDTKNTFSQIAIDFCSKSADMSFSLCSDDFLPFSFLSQSPCMKNISFCKEGILNYCKKQSNYNNNLCLNYYSENYDGTHLDTDLQVMLQDTCGNIYNSTKDKSTLDNSFYSVCGCFLPQEIYKESLTENNLDESILGHQQCWYLPCITSSVQPSTNPQCPSNEIINCIQYKYVDVKDTENNESNTKMTKTTMKDCSQVNYDFNTTESPIKEDFMLLEEQGKRLDNIFIIFICILIIMILIKKFFI